METLIHLEIFSAIELKIRSNIVSNLKKSIAIMSLNGTGSIENER